MQGVIDQVQALSVRLKLRDLKKVRHLPGIEKPPVIRRANILNCLHLGYVSSDIARILSVDPKAVTNVDDAYLERGLDSALYDEERSGRPIDFDDRERSHIVAMVCSDPPQGFLPLDAGPGRRGSAEAPVAGRQHQPRDGAGDSAGTRSNSGSRIWRRLS